MIEKDWGLIAQKILDRRELEKKGDFSNFEESRENELLSLMPIVPPSMLSAVHLPAAGDASTQHTLSTHPLNPTSQYTLSTQPPNTPSQPILSTHPLNPPSQPTLSTHPLNVLS